MITATGLPPREVRMLSFRDVSRITASWRRFPPANIAVRRLERIILSYLGVEQDDEQSEPAPMVFSGRCAGVDEAHIRAIAALANGRS
jgi:hypothetical protein